MPDAVAAYAKAVDKIKDDADLYADYADALAMSQGRRIEGAPLELVRQALRIDPAQPKALAMAGTEAFNRKDFPAAIAYWEKLLPLLPPDSEMSKSVAGGIAEARELGKIKSPGATPLAAKPGSIASSGSGVSGRVTLSPGFAAQAGPQDTLFVVARALNGPRIPLAVLRRRVADLPMDFALDDTLAMSPELKLSSFSDVIVTARISKSGNAISQAGDLQGASPAVKVGTRGIAIVIDKVVP
jgi:cytochrome c-type biogenesis protein CcmH